MQQTFKKQFMTLFSQIRPVSLREQVAEQIRNAIIEGRLRPNDHVVEGELTQQLGVSRTPIREALILLEREALIVSIPHRGRFVRVFSEADVEALFSMRTTLENFAAELVIGRLEPSDYIHLQSLIDTQRVCFAEDDFQRARSIDMAFHRYLVDFSAHPVLMRSWQELVAQVAALLYLRADYDPEYNERLAIEDHQAILEAYRNNDLERVKADNRRINNRVAGECIAAVRRLYPTEYGIYDMASPPQPGDHRSVTRYRIRA